MSKQYVIVVESTDLGIESVHGPYSVWEVIEAQNAIRDIPSDRTRRAIIVKLTRPDETATGDEHHVPAMLDSVLARYDGLATISQTTLAGLFDVANSTGHYEQADDLRDALTEQKAEIADALVSLLRKGFIHSPADDAVGSEASYEWADVEGYAARMLADVTDMTIVRNAARTDEWRERKVRSVEDVALPARPQPITDAIRKALDEGRISDWPVEES